jgi:hypothetical protein
MPQSSARKVQQLEIPEIIDVVAILPESENPLRKADLKRMNLHRSGLKNRLRL